MSQLKTKQRQRVPAGRLSLSQDDFDGKTLDEVILYLKNIRDEQSKHSKNDIECVLRADWWHEDAELYLEFSRLETDAEYNKRQEKNRVAREKAAAARRLKNERKQRENEANKNAEYRLFLKLKEKYGEGDNEN